MLLCEFPEGDAGNQVATDQCCLASSPVQKVVVIILLEEEESGGGASGQPRNHSGYAPENSIKVTIA